MGAALAAALVLAPQAAAYGVAGEVAAAPGAAPRAEPRVEPGVEPGFEPGHDLTGGIRALDLTERGRGDAVLARQSTRPFRLLGVTWTDPRARVTGPIEVRTRDLVTGAWSGWTELERHPAGLDGERPGGPGSTEPLWVGPSDGVEARVAGARGKEPLPAGLKVNLVDPRTSDAQRDGGRGRGGGKSGSGKSGKDGSGKNGKSGKGGKAGKGGKSGKGGAKRDGDPGGRPVADDSPTTPPSDPGPRSTAARPRVVTRAQWGADESEVPEPAIYLPGGRIKAAFVHHTDSRPYDCAQSATIIQGILDYHVRVEGWRDIGYNFLVDKCGTIYEGRKGGVDQPVHGAHTYGWNAQTTGVAVIGDFTGEGAPRAALASVARIIAYKLGQYGVDPRGRTTLTAGASQTASGRGYVEGDTYSFDTVSGHRDGFATACPGDGLYGQLATIRAYAAADEGTGSGGGAGGGAGVGAAGAAGPLSFGGRYEAFLPRF
ncbi:peptidoglycan recognition protein family protein [Streptomyces laurentii]|uniref:peptidoglycan recognition protein family protein n=1 Tax=Streptomyces laurentii TaxID=39478 RepID=UPI0036D06EDE